MLTVNINKTNALLNITFILNILSENDTISV